MLKHLISDIKLHKNDLLLPLLIVPIGFLAGFALLCTVMFTVDDPGTWFPMGTLTAMISLICFAVVFYMKYYQEFMLALSMGRTRREFMICYAARSLLLLVVGYGLVFALSRVELTLGGKLFAQWPLEVEFTFLTQWWFIAMLLPGVVLLSMFLGSLYSYFGKKAMAPLWFVWMALCMFGPRLAHEENAWIIALLPAPVWAGLGIAVVVVMAVTVVVLGKKQMVK